jgi:hypothetical protein
MFMLTSIEDSIRISPGISARRQPSRNSCKRYTLTRSPLWGLVISLYDITSIEGGEALGRWGALFTVIFRWWCSALREQVFGSDWRQLAVYLHPPACMSNGNVIIIIELSSPSVHCRMIDSGLQPLSCTQLGIANATWQEVQIEVFDTLASCGSVLSLPWAQSRRAWHTAGVYHAAQYTLGTPVSRQGMTTLMRLSIHEPLRTVPPTLLLLVSFNLFYEVCAGLR